MPLSLRVSCPTWCLGDRGWDRECRSWAHFEFGGSYTTLLCCACLFVWPPRAVGEAVEKRCRELMTHTDVFISRLHGELAKHMVLFPKHVRAMKAEELFGIRSEDVENVRSTADTILQSCKRPSRPPLTSHQGLSTPAAPRIAPSASAVCPGSAVPDLAAFNIEDPTSKLIMTAFVSKVRAVCVPILRYAARGVCSSCGCTVDMEVE